MNEIQFLKKIKWIELIQFSKISCNSRMLKLFNKYNLFLLLYENIKRSLIINLVLNLSNDLIIKSFFKLKAIINDSMKYVKSIIYWSFYSMKWLLIWIEKIDSSSIIRKAKVIHLWFILHISSINLLRAFFWHYLDCFKRYLITWK